MSQPIPTCHVVAMPYPGRGHINPMLNLCRRILSARTDFIVSFIVTEEWLGFLRLAPPPPPNLSFHTIPNVIPSEIGRAKDFPSFYRAVLTEMEAPVEDLLDRLPTPNPTVIIYDAYLSWVVAMGNRRNIPVAALFTMSATVFSIFHHSDLVLPNLHFHSNSSGEVKEQIINYIPGIPSIKIDDLPTPLHSKGKEVLPFALEAIKLASKAQYLLFTSIYELESRVFDSLEQCLPVKIYPIGLSIPNLYVTEVEDEKPEYMKWLDAQPVDSVLYISQGSFLSVSKDQLDEIKKGICMSGVWFLWVGRGEGWEMDTDKGIVVPWCDQLKVLCHPAVGAFWSHCGWNSTKEGMFAGVPMITFPIFWDQVTNSKIVVEDWEIGLRVGGEDGSLVRSEDVARIVLSVIGSKSEEAKERKIRAKQVGDICRNASRSSDTNILNFIRHISN